MSVGLYSHTTRSTGTILTASIYNGDHINHITNQNPLETGAYSDNVTQMQAVTDPGQVGTESLAPHLGGELERLRFAIQRLAGGAQWYSTPLPPSPPGSAPGGRLTLTTAVPVTSSDVAAATTVFYTPYSSARIELYDGTKWSVTVFSELSQLTTDATKSPAAVAASSNYDVFVWSDAGTLRATRGPAWTSDTARGTGAGTTELELFEGRMMNKVAITNGPGARRGVYVGTIRSSAASQINDTVALRHVWNNYNRVVRSMFAADAAATWTYTTLALRQANANAANQLDMVIGLSEDVVVARVVAAAASTAGAIFHNSIGLDSTTVKATGTIASVVSTSPTNAFVPTGATWSGLPGIGRHFVAWLEKSQATGTTTWSGTLNADCQSGIAGEVKA